MKGFLPEQQPSKKYSINNTSLNLLTNLTYRRFTFGYSYDLNLTDLRRTKGIFEISISYNFNSLFGKGPIPCGCK